jgi:hypothetical protein
MDETKPDGESKGFGLRQIIALVGTMTIGSIAAVILYDRSQPPVVVPTSFREPQVSFREPQVSTIAKPRPPHRATIEEALEPLKNSTTPKDVGISPSDDASGAQMINSAPRTLLGAESGAIASPSWTGTPASAALNVTAAPMAVTAADTGRTEAYSIGSTTTPRKGFVGFVVAPSVATTTTSLIESPSSGLARPLSMSIAAVIPSAGTVEEQPASASCQICCFLRGTMIATLDGDRAVEYLRPGDVLHTLSGPREIRAVRSFQSNTMPVRVNRFAIDGDGPYRDLYLSPEHALLLDGALIPVKYLVNGKTIASAAMEHIEYYHVEFDTHEVMFAEGLAVESYLNEAAKMTPAAPILRYRGGRQELAGAARRMLSAIVDVRDPIQIAHDRLAIA